MLGRLASLVLLLIASTPLFAQEDQGKIIADTWNAAYLSGHHSGWLHDVTREVEKGGQKLLRTESDLILNVARESDQVRLHMINGTEETAEGKVTGLFMRQFLSPTQQLVLAATVSGPNLITKLDQGNGKSTTKTVAWNDANLGLNGQKNIFKNRHVKPGDRFTFQSFEPMVSMVVTTHADVKGFETVKTARNNENLLRVELTSDMLDDGKQTLQLPPMTIWLDKNFDTVRTDTVMQGLGPISFHRTTKAAATTLPATGATVNIGLNSLIPLNFQIRNPYDSVEASYKFDVRGDEHPETAFARDARQTIKKSKDGKGYELIVQAQPGFRPGVNEPEPGPEFLKSNYFINSDDAKVRELTSRAVGPTTDPWQKALNIERYVHFAITNKNFEEAFATSDQVARNLKGDCTEHAVLAAAMCKAAGIPARTAVGLLYVDHQQKGPVMGFHMWAEVYVDGHWRPIDATLGQGFVGATHLKISDHSWHDVQSLTPLLPVYRVLGKLNLQVQWVQPRTQP